MTYLLLASVSVEEVIKKSRFITHAVPVHSAAEAQEKIAALSIPSATHNCWAWKIGQEYRFSDDGEPGGTAGRPMLAAIEHQGFDQVLALCIRWFGGVKLGTGGLQRAYSSGVNLCLQNAPRELWIPKQTLQGFCPYSQLSTLKARLTELNIEIEQEEFDAEGALLTINTPLDSASQGQYWLQQLTNGAQRFKTV